MFNRFSLLVLLAANIAYADEGSIQLKDGDGKDIVSTKCSVCHSLDYIQMNSVFQDRKGWEGTVGKMRKVMGAEIDDNDAAQIIDYLAKNYGK